MASDKKMEIIISLKDQFSKGMKDMGKGFNKIVEEIRGMNKAVFKTNEMVVVQLEKMNKGFKKTDKVVKSTKSRFDVFGKALVKTKDRIKKVSSSLFSLKTAFAGLGVGFIGKSFIDAASTAEGFQVRLATLLRSQQASNQAFKDTAAYARTVSHQFEELLQSSTTLAGVMHKGTEQIKEWLPLIGDLAAVSGLTMQETTSNFIRMFSAGAAAADLFRERGILAMIGIQPKVQYTVKQTRKILMDAWTDPMSRFKDSAQDLARTWKGLLSMMADRWFLFRLDVMGSDSGKIFDSLKAALALLVEKIDKMQESGELKKWAEDMSKAVTDAFWDIALGVASVYDTMAPILSNLKDLMVGLWDWFKELPEFVQTYGLIGFIMLGKKGKATIAMLAALQATLEPLKEWVQKDFEPIEIAATQIQIEKLQKRIEKLKRSLKDMPDWSEFGVASEFSRTTEEIKKLELELKQLVGVKVGSVVDVEKTKKDVKSTIAIVESLRAKIEEKRLKMIEEGKKEPKPKLEPDLSASPIKMQQAELAELKANLELHNVWLDTLYDMGLKSFGEYWAARKADLIEARDTELALLKQMIVIAEDPAQKLAAETKLHIAKQQYAQERILLLKEESQAEEELIVKKQEFYDLLNDIKERSIESGVANLEERHIQEMANLDRKHEEELEKIREHTDTIVTEEERKQALLEAAKNQEIERENKLAKQKKEILQTQLKNASTIADGMSGIATELYEMSGKNNKKMFRIAKVAAIAQAIINGALAVSKANDGTYMGYAKMAIAAAMAGIQVAKIRQTEMGGSFAEGGEIPGHSPHSKADDHQINVTSGEYVHPVSAVKYYGKRVMDGIRSRAFPPELFSGFSLPPLSYAGGGRTNFAEGGSIQALTKVAQNAPKIEIINVSNPDTIKGLAMDAVHQNRDIVVNMVLQSMEEKNITLQRDL
jgi:hypothetical protein